MEPVGTETSLVGTSDTRYETALDPGPDPSGPQSVEPYLRALVDLGGSDLHCKTGSPPRVRIDGRLRKLQAPTLSSTDTEAMVAEVLRDRPDLMDEFLRTNEGDLPQFA